MADALVIQVELDTSQRTKAAGEIKAAFKSALDGALQDAKRIAGQISTATSAGFDKARAQIDRIQAAGRAKELAEQTRHQGRLNEIQARSAAQAQVIETRKQAQIAAILARREAAEQRHQQKLVEIARNGANQSSSFFTKAFGAVSVGALALGLKSVAETAIGAAVQLDKTRQTLVALTGSTDAANAKLAELRKLAATSPGVTTKLAADTFAQLKAIGTIADQTINSVIKSVGKLNAVFTIDDPQSFTRNLVQIFSQGFERADIKEALGRVPIFEQLLEQAFGTKDAAKLRKLKDAGKLTMDAYLTGLSEAIANDTRFANVNESIGTRFDKLKDRILTSLAPVGEQIANILLPVIERIAPSIEQAASATSRELSESRSQFNQTTESARLLLQTLNDIAGKSGATFDLKQDFSVLKETIDGVNIAVSALRDVFELVGAAIEAGIKRFYIIPLRIVETVLGAIGVRVSLLSDHLTRVSLQIEKAVNRLSLGFINAQQTENAIAGINSGPFGLSPGASPGRPDLLPRRSERATALALQAQIDRLNEGRNRGGGRAGTAGSSGAGSSGAESRARAQREAELSSLRSFEENRLKLILDAVNREQDQLQDSYSKGIVSAKEYYDNKTQLTVFGLDAELDALKTQQALIEDTLSKTKGGTAEKTRLEEKLNDVLAEQILKSNKILDITRQSVDEFKKALGPLSGVDLSQQLEVQGVAGVPQVVLDARQKMLDLQKQGAEFAVLDNKLGLEEQRIQNAVTAGVLTEVEGRQALVAVQGQFRDVMIASLEAERERQRILGNAADVARLDVQVEQLRALGVELSNGQRFMRGFGSETEAVGDIFERFGQNVANSFRNVKSLFDGLKNAVKQFFSDLVGNSLQQLVRGTLGGLFGQRAAAQGGGAAGGVFGGIFGGGGGGFLTPGFNPNASGGSGGILGQIFGGGGGISAPPSASAGGLRIPGLGGFGGGTTQATGVGGFLNKIFGGLTAGGRIGLGPALLGAGLGSSLGGQSALGQLIGGIGGSAVGLGVAFGASVLGAGGGLGAAALAALGPAALIGAPLLIGAILLGRAKQRRADESTSDTYLTDAINAINAIKLDVEGDRLQGAEARSIFESQVMATFTAQINTLKTKSVRESRLNNQRRDLRNLFNTSVEPAILAQLRRKAAGVTATQLIPEFAFGGMVPGIDRGYDSVLSFLRPNEMVLTVNHQRAIQEIAGPGIFSKVGVPSAPIQSVGGEPPGYATGGRVGRSSNSGGDAVFLVELNFGMSGSTAEDILEVAVNGERGQNAIGRVNITNERNERRLKK
jgi:hypothetical protein